MRGMYTAQVAACPKRSARRQAPQLSDLQYEILQIAWRNAGNSGRLRQGARADCGKLLPRLERKRQHLLIQQICGESEITHPAHSRGLLALTREVSFVLDLEVCRDCR